ncbi:hypothetical protein BVI1335_1520021 [Burkholderia vietnamiensis]|nr:hypothetical protein BVI1335_1520021 [Burkholderia vietnamiensis]
MPGLFDQWISTHRLGVRVVVKQQTAPYDKPRSPDCRKGMVQRGNRPGLLILISIWICTVNAVSKSQNLHDQHWHLG